MLILTTYDFARWFGGGIDSTILGAIDRPAVLFNNREEPVNLVVDTLISSLKAVKSGMNRLCLYPSTLPMGQCDLLNRCIFKDIDELGNDALKLCMNSDIACSVNEVGIIIAGTWKVHFT